LKPRNEFIGGPWDGDVTDSSQPEIKVKGRSYPYTKWVEMDTPDGTHDLEIIDLDRPEKHISGSYHFRLTTLDGRRRFAYLWVPAVD
jgi:hypothetical protein